MEILQQSTSSWFSDRSLFLQDPILSSREEPIYCHILSGVMAKEYTLKLSAFAYERNLQFYKWRFGCKEDIVPIYSIQLVKGGRGEAVITVFCEKLFFSVQHFFGKLNISQQLYIFLSLIKAARQISQKIGAFRLTPEMFGLNKQGQCKTWPHYNNANNQPEYPLTHHWQMYNEVVEILTSFGWNNHEFERICRQAKKEDCAYETLRQKVEEFARKKEIKVAAKVNVTQLVKMSEEKGDCRYSELSCRPSFTFKSHQSTALTNSRGSESITQDSCMFSSLPLRSLLPKYSLKIPNHSKHHNNSQFSTSKAKPSPQSKTNVNISKASLVSKFNPTKSLGVNTKLQESILIESDVNSSEKVDTFNLNSLQKLGKIGRFCESVTAQELILEEFENIYF